MRLYISTLLLILFLIESCKDTHQDAPETFLPSVPAQDIYHGQKIEDPYRNAENLENPDVKKWIAAQNELAKQELNKINKTQYLIDEQQEFNTSKS